MIKTGIIGFSDGNGHPFSFSAIINGYDYNQFQVAGWPVILEYLEKQDPTNFGIDGVVVTHAWSPDFKQTELLCAACKIDHACLNLQEMHGSVEAVIIARDDWKTHLKIALPFLKSGVFVFVDKPLSLSKSELQIFEPFLRNKQLMSCSGFRFATELNSDNFDKAQLGRVRSIHGAVVNGVDKYGIHLIDAISGTQLELGIPKVVTRLRSDWHSFLIEYEHGASFFLECLGDVGKTFHLSLYGEKGNFHVDLHDNFGAFKNTLENFYLMTRGSNLIAPTETMLTMKTLCTMKDLRVGQSKEL